MMRCFRDQHRHCDHIRGDLKRSSFNGVGFLWSTGSDLELSSVYEARLSEKVKRLPSRRPYSYNVALTCYFPIVLAVYTLLNDIISDGLQR